MGDGPGAGAEEHSQASLPQSSHAIPPGQNSAGSDLGLQHAALVAEHGTESAAAKYCSATVPNITALMDDFIASQEMTTQ